MTGPAHPTAPGLQLLYVGIARDLRRRVLANHAGGGTGQSTLRRALAALLTEQEGYAPGGPAGPCSPPRTSSACPAGSVTTCGLTWAEHPAPAGMERAVIDTLAPPLNQAGNRAHPVYEAIWQAPARWRHSAD